jgi:hypothetical protein
VAERSKAPVLKTGRRLISASRVRIHAASSNRFRRSEGNRHTSLIQNQGFLGSRPRAGTSFACTTEGNWHTSDFQTFGFPGSMPGSCTNAYRTVAQLADALDLKSMSPVMGSRFEAGQSDQSAQPHRARRAERFSSPLLGGSNPLGGSSSSRRTQTRSNLHWIAPATFLTWCSSVR